MIQADLIPGYQLVAQIYFFLMTQLASLYTIVSFPSYAGFMYLKRTVKESSAWEPGSWQRMRNDISKLIRGVNARFSITTFSRKLIRGVNAVFW